MIDPARRPDPTRHPASRTGSAERLRTKEVGRSGRSLVARISRTSSRSQLEANLDKVNGILLIAVAVIVLLGQVAFDGHAQQSFVRYALLATSLGYPFAFYAMSSRYFFGD